MDKRSGVVERPRPVEARDRLVLALDFAALDDARRLAGSLRTWFATVKVGLELFSAVGPDAVRALRDDGFEVFVDLKLHDIPATVRRAAAAIARLGAAYATVHAAGGKEMLAAAAEGLAAGSAVADRERPTIGLGVTLLTSEEAAPGLLEARVALVEGAGLGGVVCGVPDLDVVRAAAQGLLTVVPGIRTGAVSGDDQQRTGSAAEAISRGADLLVIGRPVTEAADPAGASRQLVAAVEEAL
jgi:orotidine-5'-phosphate decarboxylase